MNIKEGLKHTLNYNNFLNSLNFVIKAWIPSNENKEITAGDKPILNHWMIV